MTADNKWSRCNTQNFSQEVQTLISQKEKTFFGFFIAFPKCAWNWKHFETKYEYYKQIISQIIDSEIDGYLKV